MNRKIIGILVIVILTAAGIAGFLFWDTAYRFTGEGRSIGNGSYHAAFDSFNGTDQFEIRLEAGEQLHLNAHLDKGSAEVSFVRSGEKSGTVIRDLTDAETTLTADVSGSYEVTVKARHAKGMIDLSADENIKDKTVYNTGKP